MTRQPKWKLIANLGDVDPFEYGGYFIFEDTTGVYCAEGVYFPERCEGEKNFIVYRFILEKCTYVDGILSDNKFHPECAAWFATPETEKINRPQDSTYLSNVATYYDLPVSDLIEMFCSDDPCERAQAYREVGEYHGFNNLDDYPNTFTPAEMNRRYGNTYRAFQKRERKRLSV